MFFISAYGLIMLHICTKFRKCLHVTCIFQNELSKSINNWVRFSFFAFRYSDSNIEKRKAKKKKKKKKIDIRHHDEYGNTEV